MAKVSITLEGSIEEVLPLLLRLAEVKPPPSPRPDWTEEEVKEVWNDLSGGAKGVLSVIAQQPDGYSWEELKRQLGLEGNQIGGHLSSLGHQLRIKGYKDKDYPLSGVDIPPSGGYKLNPVWRKVISELHTSGE